MGGTKLYTTREVANRLGITHGRVRQLAAPLKIGSKVGRDWVFTAEDIERLRQREDRRRTKPTPPSDE